MARTKNRGYQQTLAPTYTARLWKMGGYIRLSREDLQKINRGLDDSNSVKNQRDILNDFHFNHAEEFESYTEYVDDGHTGTDTERESFQRLLGDVMSGKINCVVVKDLSRFARNYSDAGSLIDNLFVQMGVRFISLAEGVDSYLNPDSVNSIIVPITNVMNDQYCYQTSKKIRQVFDYKRRNGQYIGSFAPYGYIKDPKDKHQLIVDPEAAEIVKKIYEMCLQGTAKLQIVMYLNDHGIPSPTAYRKLKGLPYSPAISDAPMWGNKIITDILRNPIYTGDLVQGRRRVKSYKVHQIEAVPEEEWVRVPDTHEAIITHETFERVQELRANKRRPTKADRQGLFSGLVYFSDCGSKLHFATCKSFNGSQDHYRCAKYKSNTGSCTAHFIREEVLKQIVWSRIFDVTALFFDDIMAFHEMMYAQRSAETEKEMKRRKREVGQAKKRIVELDRIFKRIYEDDISGAISHDRFLKLSAEYEAEQRELEEKVKADQQEVDTYEQNKSDFDSFAAIIRKYVGIKELTPAIVNEFIKKIIVHAPEKVDGKRVQKVDIVFNFVGEINFLSATQPKRQGA